MPDTLKLAERRHRPFIAGSGANAGIVVDDPATLVALGDITAPGPLLALVGTLITGALLALRVRGAILWGILGTTVLGMMFRQVPLPTSIVQVPRFSDWAPVFGKLDIPGALQLGLFEIILVFLFVDMFDTRARSSASRPAGFLTPRAPAGRRR